MDSLPFHLSIAHTSAAIANRLHALLHAIAQSSFIYYRAYLWRPISRTVFPERLPSDEELPAIDVFVVTADPRKEPPMGVMNTVLSAMALDYPPEKLSVYLSDDGASPLTYFALQEVWVFAWSWLPFCRRYGIKCRCPEAYFSDPEYDPQIFGSTEFLEEREKIKMKYELFKEDLTRAAEENKGTSIANTQIHPPVVKLMNHEIADEANTAREDMPLLVYVSREKKPRHPHHFKAGALNVLLRVSGLISNSPYILVLDCDMYSNDPSSARQAMCFHLDSKIAPSLAFVQFPQKFHNVSENDIYGGQLRPPFVVKWPGMDGLRGPILSGTCFYMKRKALYGAVNQKTKDLLQLKQSFGTSNEFLNSICQGHRRTIIDGKDSSSSLFREAVSLAHCTYERETEWGEQVGFLYNSVVEDYFTGFILHCKGWTSLFCNPSRPAFLGSATTNLNDLLVQGTRWNTGVLEVGLSKFCPLIYGPSKISILETMCYASYAFQPLYFLPLWCLSIIPQLNLLNGIPIYPKVSSTWFILFSFLCLSSLLEHLAEIIFTGGSIRIWWNELRIWIIKSITSYAFGTVDVFLKWVGQRQASFLPTNKVADEEQIKRYKNDIFDFQTSAMFLAPLVTLVILNIIAFAAGVAKMMVAGNWDALFGQVLLSFFILVVNYPIIEGMIVRKDNGRIPPSVTFLSILYAIIILSLGTFVLMW
ncbi:cellulose synthase-like protein G2 isoform X2 [Malania oleifera]|uniref:cellulose synthase-like protein G2 isoform X2 n=1 Tax=Malania oleifera TaxID=397392 RepID=UPI0025AEC60F|nr:cellulose synthase-like protein G2 isoform X2 [Malania oleifera]